MSNTHHTTMAAVFPRSTTRVVLALSACWIVRAAYASARRIASGTLRRTRTVIKEAGAELTRMNRTGLGAEDLAGQSHRERARAVAAALAHRHDGRGRCC